MQRRNLEGYWRKNITYVLSLLAIWFLVSYGAGILFADELNNIRIGGFKLGFWFAQQGSIYVFVIIIFVYVWLMNKLDKEYDVEEEDTAEEKQAALNKSMRRQKPNPPKVNS